VVPALNAEGHIEETLAAVAAQGARHRLHVIVVDNGSEDSTLEIASRWADETIRAEAGGCAVARNAGLERTTTPFMLSLDADCIPLESDWAERHLSALSSAPNRVIASAGRSIPKPIADRWAMREDITPHPAFRENVPLYAVTGNACFRTEPLRSLGGFPGIAADDAGVGMRARRAGFEFRWVPDALVYHANAPGWRGYLRQMRKIGRYGVEIDGVPLCPFAFYAERLKYIPGVLRHAAAGRWHEAAAVTLSAAGQALGARDAWRRGIPEEEVDWLT